MRSEKKQTMKSTQGFLRISEIKKDTVVVSDGTLRAILGVSSTNFDLKSQEEQNAIVAGYQRFLNSLEFPVQLLMQSRRVEVGPYLEKLRHLAEKQANELLRVQTQEYGEFISRLVENASIMSKNFYIIVPLGQSIFPAQTGFFARLFGGNRETQQRVENFEKLTLELDNRASTVTGNLAAIGVKASRLKTEEIIQLYYNSYNFEAGPVIDPAQLKDVKMVEAA